jgi:hypothetical protein
MPAKAFPILAVEDDLSEAVVLRALSLAAPTAVVRACLGKKGTGDLRKRFPELNRSAQSIPIVLLLDLDRWECPVALLEDVRGNAEISPMLTFRIAVREVESWLLADPEAFSKFARISPIKLPRDPESLSDPKQALINLVASGRCSRGRKEAIVPTQGSTASQGPGYNSELKGYVNSEWCVDRARQFSPSLDRALKAFRRIVD